jgi:hypothetical protein
MSTSIAIVIAFVALTALLIVANLWILRTRSTDPAAIEQFLEISGLRRISIRRGPLLPWDRQLTNGPGARLVSPSRFSRIFVVTAESDSGARIELRLAIDPWRDPAQAILLGRNQSG